MGGVGGEAGHVATGAEGPVAGAGQHHRAHGAVRAAAIGHMVQFARAL
ncbi:MAG: hypothetical protein BWY79_02051 [Actinobacteria bacterium ADurb.Bin444]|nr:MAG: hypothetical protein BWY79_02051 [Actinobacteria bacterium ADurb.Bin444]